MLTEQQITVDVYPWLNATLQSLMQRFLKHGLHHGLLFSGPQGIGKRQLAETLMQGILCLSSTGARPCGECQSCKLVSAQTHPDFHVLESEKQLGVDAIRTHNAKLNVTPQIGQHKVLLIPDAESMTEAASNALLKTLEEPTNNTYLILLASKSSSLLPTILSRCEKHYLAVPDTKISLQWLDDQGHSNVSESFMRAYGNAPLLVLRALQEPSELSYDDFCDGLVSLLSHEMGTNDLAAKWQGHAEQVILWCQQYYHDQFRQSLRKQDFANYQHALVFAQRAQHAGVNKSLLLTELFFLFTQ